MPKRFSGRYSRIPHRGSGVSGNHFKGSMLLKSGHKEKRRGGLELGHLWVGLWACPSWAVTPLCVGVGGAFGARVLGGLALCAPTRKQDFLQCPSGPRPRAQLTARPRLRVTLG